MKDVLKDVDIWRERGDAIALATVISVKRSAPIGLDLGALTAEELSLIHI